MGAPELIVVFVVLLILFLPTYLGFKEGSKRTIGSVGGLLLGFFFSWLGLIIVYCTTRTYEQPFYNFPMQASSAADELQKYKQLLDSGAITEEEYNVQKGRILPS